MVGVMIAAGGSVTLARPLGVAGVPYEVAPTQAAADAAKQWVFEPSDADGRTTILGFNLTPQNTSGLVDPPIQRVGGNVPPPKKLVDCKPVYPREAQDARIQGVQILEITLDPSGAVLDARALRGNPTLVRAAIDAVLQWQFEPWAGPDRRLMTVTVNFTLGDGPTTTSPGFGTPARDAAAAGVPAPVQYGRARDWPSEALRVGDAIKPPARIVDVRAVYPDIAQKAHVQGVVICDVLIGPDGRVKDARVVRSIPLLDQAAIDAVRQWEFTPTLLNGNPIPVVMTVTVNFTLQ